MFYRPLLMSVAALLFAQASLATPLADNFRFKNGSILRIDSKNALWFEDIDGNKRPLTESVRDLKILPMEDSKRAQRISGQVNEPNRRLALAKWNGQTYFIGANGTPWKTDLDLDALESWSGAWVKYNSSTYIVFSIVKKNGEIGTYLQLAFDPKKPQTIVISPGQDYDYSLITTIDTSEANGVLSFGGAKVDLKQFANIPKISLKPRSNDVNAGATQDKSAAPAAPAQSKSEPPASAAPAADGTTAAPFTAPADGKRANPFKSKAGEVSELDARLREHVYGQDHLTRKLSEHYVGFEIGKPTVLVITGPSGVGKSHLARIFAQETFKSPKFFLEIDGTDYQSAIKAGSIEHHKLVGAPAGQQGAQKGAITEWMHETDGSGVLVINEADKMHPDVWKRLMELFADGHITDGLGKTHKAKKLFIILTSNRGAQLMFPPSVANWSQAEIERRLKNLDANTVKNYYMTPTSADDTFKLPREIVNRVTEFLVAAPFSEPAVVKLAKKALEKFNKGLLTDFGVEFSLDDAALRHLGMAGFTSADDGRQINKQVDAYMKAIKIAIGEKWEELHSSRIVVRLGEEKPGQYVFLVSDGTQVLTVPAPSLGHFNPLADTAEVDRLLKLQSVLKQRIIGQDSAVKSVAEAVIARRADASNTRPASLFLVGSTGTGKTELGRAVALALYDSSDRVSVLSMGNIMSEANWNKIFGSDPGYLGSDTMREFERALIANPEGGVIVFDEVSNMGGANKEMKNALFKKLYDLTEEGKWTSPVTGKVFDLRKYVFLFTGNDGETLFQGVSSDDMRLDIWQKNKSREKLRAMLIAAGIPEAFLNRMADTILMKPLLKAEINGVITKLLTDRVRSFEKQYRGLKITYSQDVLQQLADSFFTSDRGGRGIRSILDDRMPTLLAFALLNSHVDTTDLSGVEARLTLTDNLSKKPYRLTKAPERKVEMALEVVSNGTTLHRQVLDATELASMKPAMGVGEATLTAFHEAGHAVVNEPKETGEALAYITIEGGFVKGQAYLGYARYEPIPTGRINPTRQSVVATIAKYYAGSLAQVIAGYGVDAGWSQDLKQIRKVATNALVQWGLEPSLIGIALNSNDEPILNTEQQRLFQVKMDALIEEGRLLAMKQLTEKWPLVRSIAAELLKRGNINAARFAEIEAPHIKRATERAGMCQALF